MVNGKFTSCESGILLEGAPCMDALQSLPHCRHSFPNFIGHPYQFRPRAVVSLSRQFSGRIKPHVRAEICNAWRMV